MVTIGATSPQAVIPGKPSLALLKYQNLGKVWFRMFSLKPEEATEIPSGTREEQLKEALSRPILKTWETVLPTDSDYRPHSAEVLLPALKPGYYLVAASSTPDFNPDAPITLWNLWSSRLALVERRNEKGGLDIMVLDREKGIPLEKVKIQPWSRKYTTSRQKYTDQPGAVFLTDARGEATVILPREKETYLPYYLVLTLGQEKFITRNSYSGYYGEGEEQKQTRTFLFTDRAIYRPGQTVWFKGIVMDMEGDSRTLRKGVEEEITFRDVNGQEVSKLKLVTNEFGSFTGNFAIPLSGLTGEMSISGQYGSLGFRVEEYKRPKFEVVFDPVEGAPQLNREVVVKGKASAYAGSKISEASVTWRVVRNARFPRPWWWGGGRFPSSPAMEIASGTATTGSEGEFEIRFTAIPDVNIAEKLSPVFTYTVHTTVTAINGETHDGETSVSAGYESLMVSTNLAEEVNRAEAPDIMVTTTNLNGVPEKATGKVTVQRLTPPAWFLYPRLLEKPDRHTLPEKEFRELFPGEVYGNEEDRSTWPAGDPVISASFETPGNASVSGLRKLQPGHYVLKITTTDPFGKTVHHTHYFTLFTPAEGKTVSFKPLTVTLLTPKAEPGETASFLVATPLRKAYVKVAIFSKAGEPRYRYYRIDNGQIRVDIPVTEADRGNIGIRVIMAKENHLFQEEIMLTVPYSNKELDITVGSFRDKLLPGQEEEWRITIRDKNRDLAAAELLATMYDASLDIFTPHQWYFSLYYPFGAVPVWDDKGFGQTLGRNFWVGRETGDLRFKTYEQLLGGLFGAGNDQLFYRVENFMVRGMAPTKSARGMVEPAIGNG